MLYYQRQLPRVDFDTCLSPLTVGLTLMPFLELKILKKRGKKKTQKVVKPPTNSNDKINNLYLGKTLLTLLKLSQFLQTSPTFKISHFGYQTLIFLLLFPFH
jgi:hypothetical protein